jgi:hypothetical protein
MLRSAAATAVALVGLTALVACGNEYHPEYHPESAYSYSQNISQPVTIFAAGNQQAPVYNTAPPPAPAPGVAAASDPSRILVLETTHLDRPAQVLGVIDAHEEMGKHEEALWKLKTKAAAMGADAVVGVEFHHGEGEGEPTHLSGLAVKFLPPVPYPVD